MTYATTLGLLSAIGMRVSEVLNLDRDDVDLTHGVLTVRDSKFGKSRNLPVHESTTQALRRYARRRDRLCCPNPLAPAFFLAERATPITQWALRWTFAKLSRQVGLRAPLEVRHLRPRTCRDPERCPASSVHRCDIAHPIAPAPTRKVDRPRHALAIRLRNGDGRWTLTGQIESAVALRCDPGFECAQTDFAAVRI